MSKQLFKIILIFLLVFGVGIVGIQAQDTEEKPVLMMTILSNGEVVSDFLSSEIQTRVYAFNANEGDTVTISMTQLDDELDPLLVLLGPAGEVIQSDDDSGEVSLSALMEDVVLPAQGTYFIIASSFHYINSILAFESEEAELDYEMRISGVSTDKSTKFETSDGFQYYAGELVFGETLNGASTLEEPVFYFKFYGEAGQKIDLEMTSEEFDTILHVFAPGGLRIAVNDDRGDGTTNSEITGLELPDDGIYLVFATDIFFYNAANEEEETLAYKGGNFQITLAESSSSRTSK